MRVLPWNQGLLPLAPSKSEEGESGGGRGCAAFFLKSWCGGGRRRKDGGGALPVKVEAVHPSSGSVGAASGDGFPMVPPATVSTNGESVNENVGIDGDGVLKTCLKSSLKKPRGCSAGSHPQGKRKVQWTDLHGQDLVQIREFEMSDSSGSDDEDDGGVNNGCGCIIQ